MTGEPLLSVRGLSVDFSTYGRRSQVLRDVSLDVPAHRHVALVGESGCGKSVTMRTIMGILPTPPARIVCGQILFDGRDLLAMRPRERERLRGTAMSMVFQDPMTSLNPVFTIGDQMATILKYADRRLGRVRADSAVLRLLEALPGTPIVTAAEVRAMLGVSLPSAIQAIERLLKAEILHPATARQRRQVFEAREVINLFTNLERQLASPTGDTIVARPARRVPAKPRIPRA